MGQIIDHPTQLMKLSSAELDELLLDKKYNKANLRELVKRCVAIIKTRTELSDLYKSRSEEYRKRLFKVKSILDGYSDADEG